MLISESWLREWASPEVDTEQLGELLTQAGLEVETITQQAHLGDKVLVGEITAIEKHPDADKLNICSVNVGEASEVLTIVCGASNAEVGLKAPVALIGAVLPGDFVIAARKVRGVASAGMICAASELGLEAQSSGLLALSSDAPVGALIDDYLDITGAVIDVDLTPDRGDCLCILGVARDVAALSKAKLTQAEAIIVPAAIDAVKAVNLAAPKECPRYAGRIIKNINLNSQTPDYIKNKLRKSGLKSISPAVDVTNYVMLELGQPMHAFDVDKLEGDITVRMAKQDEALLLLDGQDITLQDDMLVIADDKKAIALAGIMGGGNSEIDENTQNIMLEAAYFSPLVIAGKARALGLHTDSSHRFERGVDSMLQITAIERATGLLLDIVGGEAGPIFEKISAADMPEIQTIALRPARISAALGLSVDDALIKQHLESLQMQVNDSKLPWQVTRPSWRFDVTGEHDLVEEIGRLEGLDKIAPKAPELRAKPFSSLEKTIDTYTLKTWLASMAYREAISYSFIAPEDQQAVSGEPSSRANKAVDLANPIASNMAQMRLSILPGLLNAARNNEQRQHHRVNLFETGKVFAADESANASKNKGTGVRENMYLALLSAGKRSATFWAGHGGEVDFYDLKGDLDNLFDRIGLGARIRYKKDNEINASQAALHPGQSALILLDGENIGRIGALHPSVQKHFDLNLSYFVAELDLAVMLEKAIPEFQSLSKFPETTRDIAVVVEEAVLAGDLYQEIQSHIGALLKKCELFDHYRGENIGAGNKSLAFALTLQSKTESLENERVDSLINDLLANLKEKFGAILRA